MSPGVTGTRSSGGHAHQREWRVHAGMEPSVGKRVDEILSAAERAAQALSLDAERKREELLDSAQREASEIVKRMTEHARRILAEADVEARRHRHAAEAQAERIVEDARERVRPIRQLQDQVARLLAREAEISRRELGDDGDAREQRRRETIERLEDLSAMLNRREAAVAESTRTRARIRRGVAAANADRARGRR